RRCDEQRHQGVVLELWKGCGAVGSCIYVGRAAESSDRLCRRHIVRVAAGGWGSSVDHRWISPDASRFAGDVRGRWCDADRCAIDRFTQPTILFETGSRTHLSALGVGDRRYQLVPRFSLAAAATHRMLGCSGDAFKVLPSNTLS